MSAALDAPELLVDVDVIHLARVYAESVLRAAVKAGREGDVAEQLAGLARLVADSPKSPVAALFTDASIPLKAKADLLGKAFGNRVDPVLLDGLRVMNDHERLALLRPVAVVYRNLLEERNRKFRVQVRTAHALSDDQKARLAATLKDRLGIDPVLEEVTDPALLGGLTVQVGDYLYDGSVGTRIQKLRKQLLERSSHEIQRGRDRIGSAG